jgi:hypothetical protein
MLDQFCFDRLMDNVVNFSILWTWIVGQRTKSAGASSTNRRGAAARRSVGSNQTAHEEATARMPTWIEDPDPKSSWLYMESIFFPQD